MRLIDADALMWSMGCVNAAKYGNKTVEQQHNSYSTMMMYEIADYIEDAPTIDAAPVVHARWEETNCTACGKSYMEYAEGCSFPAYCENELYTPDFCPHCGAIMDAEEAKHGQES